MREAGMRFKESKSKIDNEKRKGKGKRKVLQKRFLFFSLFFFSAVFVQQS